MRGWADSLLIIFALGVGCDDINYYKNKNMVHVTFRITNFMLLFEAMELGTYAY